MQLIAKRNGKPRVGGNNKLVFGIYSICTSTYDTYEHELPKGDPQFLGRLFYARIHR